ncbi:MAG: cytochrome c biogenesis protein CcdA [Actinomycetales bacterium]|nr:cytochrome c biogenesis protein CcdA [Actinomycetales bacterium]
MSDIADTFAEAVLTGPMIAAVGVALVAGFVSFASPCVLPLIPGYVGYLGGMAGSVPGRAQQPDTRRVLWGMVLFVLGFTAVFVLLGIVFAAAGAALARWTDVIMRVLGVVVILMGVAFVGHIPFLQKDTRITTSPRFGLWGAPLLGATFALGWSPCIGPTLAAVLTLSFGGADPTRGAILALAYCIGLGIPFIVIALAFTRSTRALAFMKSHRRAITRAGGVVLILVGSLLVTGLWNTLTAELQGWIAGFATVV